MKIAFDAKRAAQNRTGLGNYSRFIIRILSQQGSDELHLYIPNPRHCPFLAEIPTVKQLHLHFPIKAPWRKMRSLWRVWGVTADVRHDCLDIYHGLSNELPLNVRSMGCKTVVTVHDLIFLRHPEFYKPIDRWIYNLKFSRACRNADRIIAVSEFTKRDIIHYYNIDKEKIDVVYQGCDPAFAAPISNEKLVEVRERYGLPERFVLYVGSIEERKNARLLIDAAEKASKAGQTFDVVLVGRPTTYCQHLKYDLETMTCRNRCHFFHSVPFADLPAFYHLATLFVYPSVVEGFGIPMLEAITAGIPAIGCKGSCLEEAGGPASIYVAPDDSNTLASTIIRLLNDDNERQRMIDAGHDYARRFADDRLRNELMNVYQKALAETTTRIYTRTYGVNNT